MKRILCLCLSVILLLGTLSFGCANVQGKGSEVLMQFLALVTEGNYQSAFELLSPTILNTTGQATPNGEPFVTYTEFSDKYLTIYDAIGLESIEYTIDTVSDASITSLITYTMTYHTERSGDLTNKYELQASYQDGRWGVLWSPAQIFPNMEWGDRLLIGVNYPKRGEIFDAHGNLLVENVAPITVFCVPTEIEDKEAYVKEVLAIPELKVDEKTLRERLAANNSSAVVALLYPDEVDESLEARILALPNTGIDKHAALTSTRFRGYPYGTSASHLLGFAAVMWAEDWKKLKDDPNNTTYEKDSWLGYAGLELQYEELLRGEKGGYAYIQGKNGQNRQTLYNIPAKDGQDLHLTLDIDLQLRVEQVVDTIVYDKDVTGTVVVLDPTTGALKASYSFPDYDVEAFSRGIVGDAEWTALQKDPQTPMLNRTIQGLYAPGSTFKPLTGIAALETGELTTEDVFPSTERILNGAYISNSGNYKDAWFVDKGEYAYTQIEEITRTSSSNRHTPMNMESSIIDSDNIYFSWAALKLGWDRFKNFMEYIGIGEAIPFDMPTQPSQVKKPDSIESYALLAMSGYGQGELLLTPLQMGAYIGSFTNDGKAMEPYLVDSIWEADGTDYEAVYTHEPKTWKTLCNKTHADAMEQMMIGVCRLPENGGGTARFLGVRSFIIAGKTGTAEVGEQKEKELAWFIGYRAANRDGSTLAAEDERLVVVMLELDMNDLPQDYAMMKFMIAQALLKDDDLSEPGITETAIVEDNTSNSDVV